MNTLGFRHLAVYQTAIELVIVTNPVIRELARIDRSLANQLRRAVASVALNIAEGAGEYSPGEKARIWRIARRSATETASIYDILLRQETIDRERNEEPDALILGVVRMLTALIKKNERKALEPRTPMARRHSDHGADASEDTSESDSIDLDA